MTAEEKTTLFYLINLASDYIRDGHSRGNKDNYTQSEAEEKATLPLAYMVEEPSDLADLAGSEVSPEQDSLETVAAEIRVCEACGLAATRTKTVPGEGAERPLVMVIGEGPGADEDAAGRPFVGRAGQLLDRMLGSIGLFRGKNCFIANMVKCRPPGNRDPGPEETAACRAYLERQIALLKPKLILCAGRVASQNLLKTSKGINALRGDFIEFKPSFESDVISVLPTFHPSAILRDESLKRPAWEDLKLLKSRLESLGESEA